MQARAIAVDPGFGNVKAAMVNGDVRVAVVPSVVGVGETDTGLISIGDLGRQRRRRLPDRVAFDGFTYLVGDVARYARPVQRMDFHRLSDGPELRALLYDALYRLLGAGEHRDLALLVGLPVEVMGDRSVAQETLRGLRGWLVGEHRYRVNGEEVTVGVSHVWAMTQPAGAFFAWGLDNEGRWIRGAEMLTAPIAVCDIGFNTLDLLAVEGGEVVGRFTGGDTAGMRRAAELLINAVKAKYGVTLSPHEADALLRRKRPRLYTTEGEVDLRPQVEQALNTAAAGIIAFVERQWGNGRQFTKLLFVGGGSRTMKDAVLRQYPHGIILPDPVTANAIGLARYGVRMQRKAGER